MIKISQDGFLRKDKSMLKIYLTDMHHFESRWLGILLS